MRGRRPSGDTLERPPGRLTLSRESSTDTARSENSNTTRAATRVPTSVRIRANPARCAVSREAHWTLRRSFSSLLLGLLWGQSGGGGGGAESTFSLEGGGSVCPACTLQRPRSVSGRAQGLAVDPGGGTHLAQLRKKYTFRRLLRTETPQAPVRPERAAGGERGRTC